MAGDDGGEQPAVSGGGVRGGSRVLSSTPAGVGVWALADATTVSPAGAVAMFPAGAGTGALPMSPTGSEVSGMASSLGGGGDGGPTHVSCLCGSNCDFPEGSGAVQRQ